jgi:5,10-methylenetetrahydromethanopterin reductase
MQISILDHPARAEGRTIIDSFVEQVAQLRDEGFSRLWCTQMPYERDLLTRSARACCPSRTSTPCCWPSAH